MLNNIKNTNTIYLFEGKEDVLFLFKNWPEIFTHEKLKINLKSYIKIIYLKAQLSSDSYVLDLLYFKPIDEEMIKLKITVSPDNLEVQTTKNVSLLMSEINREYMEVKSIHMASIVSENKSKSFNK